MNKKMAAIGLTAGLAAGGVAGLVVAVPTISGAQTTDTTTASSDPSTATPPAGAERRSSHLAETLNPLVQDGTITQDQADKVIDALVAAGPMRGEHGPVRGAIAKGLDDAATALGISEADLRSALRDGQTLAKIAEAQGVDVQTVIDALVADVKTHLDEKVASGDMTQEEADARLAESTERITDLVNNGRPARGEGRGPGSRGIPDTGSGETS